MVSNRLVLVLLCATATIGVASGCGSQQKQNTTPVSTQAPIRPADPQRPSRVNEDSELSLEPKFNAPDALARKTAEYSQQVQSAIGSDPRGINAPSTKPATPNGRAGNPGGSSLIAPPKGSRVQWGDSMDLRPRVGASANPQQPLDYGQVPHSSKPPIVESSPGTANAPSNISDKNPADKAQVAANTAAAITPQNQPVSAAGLNVGDGIANSTELGPKITRKVKEYPRDVSGHLDFQLLRFLLDDRVPDQGALSPLPTEDRELMNTVIDGLVNFRSSLRQDNNMLLSRKVKPLLEMSDRLRAQADLSVPTIALCTQVRTFGEYDPIDPARFEAGKDHDVVLYCEVENFSSQLDEHQFWQTKLTQEAVLYSEQGLPVWADKNQQISDSSRRRRHDFFIVKLLKLPANLVIGRYLMKVTITDQQVNRIAEATIPIIVTAR